MKIYSDDGKEFKTIDECNAYEANLALIKEKEEAERKAKIKKDAQLKKLRQEKLNEIKDMAKAFNNLIKDYENETGMKLTGACSPLSGTIYIQEAPNKLDYAWDSLITDVINIISSNK